MLSAAARQAAGPLSGTAPAALVGAAQLIRDLGAPVAAAAVDGTRSFTAGAPSRSSSGDLPRAHVFDENDAIVGPQTPVTKRLWATRYKWTADKLAAAAPRDPAAQVVPKPPKPLSVTYSFAGDEVLREHYRSPWAQARIGRLLEDLDSLAGYVAFEHCDDGDPSTRPPLLVTASVERIELRGSRLTLEEDMEMSGRVVWTGASSLDIRMELVQAGQLQLSALFTFVARDPLSGKACRINPVQPQTQQDRELFEERQRVNDARKAARKAAAAEGKMHNVSSEGERWARELLAAAKTKRDLPALADPNVLLMDELSLENTFTCQPQQRNMHGRIFGGFLMRRAFELAHSTAYLYAGCRPQTLEVDTITFQRPVSVGDLIRFKSWVLRSWPSQRQPGKGVAHISVEASVTQPERLQSAVTNTFGFRFSFDLKRDAFGNCILPKTVLPANEHQAMQVAEMFAPTAETAAAGLAAAPR